MDSHLCPSPRHRNLWKEEEIGALYKRGLECYNRALEHVAEVGLKPRHRKKT